MHLNHTKQASNKLKSSSGHKVMQGISLLNQSQTSIIDLFIEGASFTNSSQHQKRGLLGTCPKRTCTSTQPHSIHLVLIVTRKFKSFSLASQLGIIFSKRIVSLTQDVQFHPQPSLSDKHILTENFSTNYHHMIKQQDS
jgi:hypothetical protein